ncbi:MAG TPA: protein kinase [Gemmatimonadaceae bacterium]
MTDALPTQIGKYKIQELVGEGAMGTVYRAVDSVIGRTVAIKVMNASIARQQDHRQRFLREAQAAGSLQHPNVVTIYDLGELDGHLFIAMEYVHGTDLERLMTGAEPLKLQSKLDIIVDVLMGLSYAHKHGIVHRDIKPANVRVGEDGHAKIMDFGVAHLASSDMTRTGIVVGTPSYMAPEQVMGGKAVPGTDLFAVGAVLYHLITGSKPFEGPTLQSLFYRIVTDMPKPLDEVRPGLPTALNTIIQKAMAKDAADRYETALDMANAIIAVRAELSGNAYASTASLTTSAVHVVESFAPKPVPVEAPRSLPWKSIGGATAAAAVLLIGWMAFARPSDDSRPVTIAESDTASAPLAVVDTTPGPPVVQASAMTAVPETTASAAAKKAEDPSAAATKRQREAVQRERERDQARRAAKTAVKPAPQKTTPPVTRAQTQPQPAVTLPAPPVVSTPIRDTPQRVVVTPPPPPPSAPVRAPDPEPVRNPREEITGVVAAYARAIESRDIGAVRRAYPGITSEQARGFEQFFQSARSISVTFRVNDLDVNGNSADARLIGTYQYVSSEGKSERQAVSFSASLRNDGGSWRLIAVR